MSNEPVNVIYMKELDTQEKILEYCKGKTIKDIKYTPGYSDIDIIFTDDTYISINAEDCFRFSIDVPEKKEN